MNMNKNSFVAPLAPVARMDDEVRYVTGEVIPPATTADVRTPGKALDTDDMVTLIGTMSIIMLVFVLGYGLQKDWAFATVMIFWAACMAGFVLLITLVQSRTLVQVLATFFHAANERFRLWCQSRLADRHYRYMEFAETEDTKRHSMTEETKRITAQAQIAEQQLTIRRIADSSTALTQNHSNMLTTYSNEPDHPVIDHFKADVLSYLIELTEKDERGNPSYVTTSGRVNYTFPWSTRGEKANEAQRFWRLISLAENSLSDWIIRSQGKAYYFNIDELDKQKLLDAFARISSDAE